MFNPEIDLEKFLERFPPISDWSFEDRSDLKLVDQAPLEIISEKVVIIDPGYTEDLSPLFDQDFFRSLKEPAFLRLLRNPRAKEIAIISGEKGVYLGNFGGDGNYPILKTEQGIEIALDYSYTDLEEVYLNLLEKRWESNNPNILGSVWVDYKMIMLADPSKVRLKVPSDANYDDVLGQHSFSLSNGRYNVSFKDTGDTDFDEEAINLKGPRGRVVQIEKLFKL